MIKQLTLLITCSLSFSLLSSQLDRETASNNSAQDTAQMKALIDSNAKIFQNITLGKSWKIVVNCYCFSPNHRFALAGNQLQDVSQFPAIQSVTLDIPSAPTTAVFSADNKLLLVQTGDSCAVWDLDQFPVLKKYSINKALHKERLQVVALCTYKSLCVVRDEKSSYHLINFDTLRHDPCFNGKESKDEGSQVNHAPVQPSSMLIPYFGKVDATVAKFSSDGSLLVIGFRNGDISMFDLNQCHLVKQHFSQEESNIRAIKLATTRHNISVEAINFSDDHSSVITSAKSVAIGDDEAYIAPTLVWSLSGKEPLQPTGFNMPLVFDSLQGQNENQTLTFNYSQKLSLWDVIPLPTNIRADICKINASNEYAFYDETCHYQQLSLSDLVNFVTVSLAAHDGNKVDVEIMRALPKQLRIIAARSLKSDVAHELICSQ